MAGPEGAKGDTPRGVEQQKNVLAQPLNPDTDYVEGMQNYMNHLIDKGSVCLNNAPAEKNRFVPATYAPGELDAEFSGKKPELSGYAPGEYENEAKPNSGVVPVDANNPD